MLFILFGWHANHDSDDFSPFVNFVVFQITREIEQHIYVPLSRGLTKVEEPPWIWVELSRDLGFLIKRGLEETKGGLVGSTFYCPHLCFLHQQSMSTLFNYVFSAVLD